MHLTGFAAVVSVHITMLSAPVKQASLTEAVPSLSVALPLQGAPEDIANPPSGPHELTVVGGTGGCDATCKHPDAINPAIASPAIINIDSALESALASADILTSANIGTIPRIRSTSSAWFMNSQAFDSSSPDALILSGCGHDVAPVEAGAEYGRDQKAEIRNSAYEPFARSPGR